MIIQESKNALFLTIWSSIQSEFLISTSILFIDIFDLNKYGPRSLELQRISFGQVQSYGYVCSLFVGLPDKDKILTSFQSPWCRF